MEAEIRSEAGRHLMRLEMMTHSSSPPRYLDFTKAIDSVPEVVDPRLAFDPSKCWSCQMLVVVVEQRGRSAWHSFECSCLHPRRLDLCLSNPHRRRLHLRHLYHRHCRPSSHRVCTRRCRHRAYVVDDGEGTCTRPRSGRERWRRRRCRRSRLRQVPTRRNRVDQ